MFDSIQAVTSTPAVWIALIVPVAVWRGLRLLWPNMQLLMVTLLLGVVLGPSMLGWSDAWFPHSDATFRTLASWAVTGMGWFAGLHMAVALLPQSNTQISKTQIGNTARALALISVLTIAAQIALAAPLASILSAWVPNALSPLTMFGLMIVLPVIALPVLSVALDGMGLTQSQLGRTALRLSMNSELYLWPAMIGLLAVVNSTGTNRTWLELVGLITLYGCTMWFLIRPTLARLEPRWPWLVIAMLLPITMISVHVSEVLGLHNLLGAVLAGLVVPPALANRLSHGDTTNQKPRASLIQQVITFGLTPFFLLSIGFFHRFTFDRFEIWVIGAVLGVASGAVQITLMTHLARRWLGFEAREATALGWLSTMRGMVEIVVAKQLLEMSIIDTLMYQGILLMTLAQTLLGPLMASWSLKSPQRLTQRRENFRRIRQRSF